MSRGVCVRFAMSAKLRFLLLCCFVVVLDSSAVFAQRNDTCTPCAVGTYYDKAQCGDCDEGFCDKECLPCPPGSSGRGGRAACTPCCPGTFSEGGQGTCTLCPAGTGSGDGYSSCCVCAAGRFSQATELSSCNRKGRLLIDATILRSTLQNATCTGTEASCVLCPMGTYRRDGDSFCTGCGIGMYGTLLGATDERTCRDCPSGSFCPFDATSQPIECPKDHKCSSNAREPEICSALDSSSSGSKECERTPVFVLLILGIVLSIVTYISLVYFFWRQYRQKISDDRLSSQSSNPIYQGL
eukprot:TRINITY_DN12911_c0_g1_i1.p1 TRINITY_DN12911_c0_g1~~TRINITY_DN12911_c0_g1_i1.p1  ORF type:complete len:298 (+),score=22.56 TRINITY_DN12911_c0_g1_i1:82-975(+)